MTGKTHQLIALTAVAAAAARWPQILGIGASLLALIAAMSGALTPDIDHPAANIWKRFPAGSIVGRIVRMVLGGHRNISHSILGAVLITFLSRRLLDVIHPDYLAQALAVRQAYLVGYYSHLASDTFTDRGIPWFWPLRLSIGLPPGPATFRITTGSVVERRLLRPLLLALLVAILAMNWADFRSLLG